MELKEYRLVAKLNFKQQAHKIVEIVNDNTLILKENDSLTQIIDFNQILGPYQSSQKNYDVLCRHSVNKLIEGLHSTILLYGGPVVDRLSLLFGYTQQIQARDQDNQDQETGIILRTMQHIFMKVKELSDSRQFFITCNCMELEFDSIRDITRQYLQKIAPISDKDKKKKKEGGQPTIIEEEGHYKTKDLIQQAINNVSQFKQFLQYISKSCSKASKSHLIIEFDLVQSDKEMNVPMPMNSSLTFVSLANSQSPDFTYQQNLCLSNQLSCLNQVLLSLNHRYSQTKFGGSKLTKVLQRVLNQSSYVTLVGNLVISNETLPECMSILQFINSTKVMTEDKQNKFANKWNLQKSLKSELQNSKKKLNLIRNHQERLNQLIKYLGIDVDSILANKDTNQNKKFKKALEKLKFISSQKQLLEEKLKFKEQTLRQLQLRLSDSHRKQSQVLRILKQQKAKLQQQEKQQLQRMKQQQQANHSDDFLKFKQSHIKTYCQTFTRNFSQLFPNAAKTVNVQNQKFIITSKPRQENKRLQTSKHDLLQAIRMHQQNAIHSAESLSLKQSEQELIFRRRENELNLQFNRLKRLLGQLYSKFRQNLKLTKTYVRKPFHLSLEEQNIVSSLIAKADRPAEPIFSVQKLFIPSKQRLKEMDRLSLSSFIKQGQLQLQRVRQKNRRLEQTETILTESISDKVKEESETLTRNSCKWSHIFLYRTS